MVHNHSFSSIVAYSSIIIMHSMKSICQKGHYRPTSETPLQWRFAGGPLVAPIFMITGLLLHLIISGFHSFRGDKVQDKSGFPDCALMHFGHEIIVIIALIWF